jgi:VIT1/CCC1 family predicted Fe2+/Mn2+ transporter
MMLEEHGLVSPAPHAERRAALVVGLAALAGSLLPLAPFLIWRVSVAIAVAVPLGACCLFAAGAWNARATVGRPIRAGIELAAIGTASALVGWGIGLLFHV